MPRFKSRVATTQSPGPSLSQNGEIYNCGHEYCMFSCQSIDELAKHVDHCQFAPFTAPKSKRPSSAPIEPVEVAKVSLAPLNRDQENGVPVTQQPNGSSAGDDSSSSLSDPPPISNFSELEAQFDPEAREARRSEEKTEGDTLLDDTIRAYVDEKTKFVFYDTAREVKPKIPTAAQDHNEPGVVATELAQDIGSVSLPPSSKGPKRSAVVNSGKYPFPEMVPIDVFDDYLVNPQAMTYTELYHKTSRVTDVMMELQSEWDRIDKECRNHEEAEKLKTMTAAEREKAIADEKQEDEDLALISLEQTYREELKMSRKPWVEDFSIQFLKLNPDDQLTLERLNKLRDSAFVKGFKKRQRALQENRPEQLVDKPLPDPKQTKEERDLEARKRRHLTDKITFDDMAQADAYGFTYLASDLARGNQLVLPKLRVVNLPKNLKAGSRPPRNATKGSVVESAENSDVLSGEEELPQKRSRAKPKKLEDDTNGASSAAESSRGGGSAKTYLDEDGVRRYKSSNKPSGRPATTNKTADRPGIKKSKLDQMSLAEQAEQSNNIEDEGSHDINGEPLNGQVLGSDQEDELQIAAGLLVNQTLPVQQRKRGGRPKKVQPVIQNETGDTPDLPPPKPKGKGGRPRKVIPVAQPLGDDEVEEGPQIPPKAKGKGGRKKRVREEDDTVAAENGGPATKKIKKEGAISIKMKIPAANSAADSDEGKPLASIEQQPQSTQSSRPTSSSSKPTTTSKPVSPQAGSRPGSRGGTRTSTQAASRGVSKAPAVATTTKINGKRVHDEISDEVNGIAAGTSSYNSNTEDGTPASKRVKKAKVLAKSKVNGTSNDIITNGNLPVGEVKKKKATAKRRRIDGEEGLTGADNTADATNNNSGADDGGLDSKRSKKSREKTAAEKASQSAAMKNKWADPHGKMRQGIERRKRRDARKAFERKRVETGGAPTPDICYKSDEEGYNANNFPAVLATPPVPIAPPPAPAFFPDPKTGEPTPTAGDQIERNDEDEDEDGDAEAAKLAVESPQKGHRPKNINTNIAALTTTRFGRQSKPSRKVNTMGLDGADEDSDDEEDEGRPALLIQKSESTYDEFQKLTSPGHQLGKRVSKPLYKVNYGTTSEEEEEEEEDD